MERQWIWAWKGGSSPKARQRRRLSGGTDSPFQAWAARAAPSAPVYALDALYAGAPDPYMLWMLASAGMCF